MGDGSEVRTVMLKTFWLSWYEPFKEARDYHPLVPLDPGNRYWCTGFGRDDTSAMLCALVKAPSEESAWKMVARWWAHKQAPKKRFCEEKPYDWTPGDRFPMPKE